MIDDLEWIENLEKRLKGEKPGLTAQLAMAPQPRPGQVVYQDAEESSLKAGVMVLLYSGAGTYCLVLIRRSSSVLHHKDQISFPGGQIEPGENFEQAASRETWEELGVPPDRVKILGSLTPLYIPPSRFCIYPVVGVADEPLRFRPHPREVAEVIEVPVRHLLDSRHIGRETRVIDGRSVVVPFYSWGPHKIWGATAMVLAEFLDLLRTNLIHE
jgi:8-oxo-dGTP pyrophosphatase MutT (NUDIX family)